MNVFRRNTAATVGNADFQAFLFTFGMGIIRNKTAVLMSALDSE